MHCLIKLIFYFFYFVNFYYFIFSINFWPDKYLDLQVCFLNLYLIFFDIHALTMVVINREIIFIK